MRRLDLGRPGLLVEDEALRMELLELPPGSLGPIVRHSGSDVVFLFLEGGGEFRTADRVHKFTSVGHAFASAGAAFQVANTGDRILRYIKGLLPRRRNGRRRSTRRKGQPRRRDPAVD